MPDNRTQRGGNQTGIEISEAALTLMNLGRTVQAQAVLREALKLHPWLPERHMLIKLPGEDL